MPVRYTGLRYRSGRECHAVCRMHEDYDGTDSLPLSNVRARTRILSTGTFAVMAMMWLLRIWVLRFVPFFLLLSFCLPIC